jgi:hypothetical protein
MRRGSAAYAAVVAVGGDLLLSGILDPRDRLVRASLEALNAAAGATGGPRLASIDERRDGDWWLLHLRREA